MSPLDLLIWGSGSQARIYLSLAESQGLRCLVLDPRRDTAPDWLGETPYVGTESELGTALSRAKNYCVAIGDEHGKARYDISMALQEAGLSPVTLIDPSANVKAESEVGPGGYLAQNVTVNIGVRLGRDTILNTACTIDHECQIGKGVHIMGAAALAGRVQVGDFAVIGTNATILPDVTIGLGAYIGAGAVVTEDVSDYAVCVGVPGQILRQRELTSDAEAVEMIRKASQ